jgi:PKD repeat protein
MKRWSWIVVCVLLLGCAVAEATTAVIGINAEPWYVAKAASLGNLSLTRGYAPFPVFFEGCKSEPWGDSTEYRWDFGDGSACQSGFNAAHVYEKPGLYLVTLNVVDGAGAAATATQSVEVLAPDRRTFYVDAEAGNDANDGLAPERAWKTADKALSGLGGRYLRGDRVLFKRGQVFPLAGRIQPPRDSYGYGFSFGAYGEGERPIIQRANGGSANEMLDFLNGGLRHVGFMDLAFDGTSPDRSVRSSVVRTLGAAQGLLFLRCSFRNGYQHLGINGPSEVEKGCVSGVFVVGCQGRNSGNMAIYIKAKRVALLDNDWERSGENMVYGSWAPYSLIAGNWFRYPDFGRTALRISGGSDSFERPAEYVCVAGNKFQGWIDPVVGRDGTNGARWNYTLCTMSPNVDKPQWIRHVRWERNLVWGCETALQLGDCEDVVVRWNVFDLPNITPGSARIKLGSPECEQRPLRDIRFRGNLILCDEARSNGGSMGAIFGLLAYRFAGAHVGISAIDNRIEVRNGVPAV